MYTSEPSREIRNSAAPSPLVTTPSITGRGMPMTSRRSRSNPIARTVPSVRVDEMPFRVLRKRSARDEDPFFAAVEILQDNPARFSALSLTESLAIEQSSPAR